MFATQMAKKMQTKYRIEFKNVENIVFITILMTIIINNNSKTIISLEET